MRPATSAPGISQVCHMLVEVITQWRCWLYRGDERTSGGRWHHYGRGDRDGSELAHGALRSGPALLHTLHVSHPEIRRRDGAQARDERMQETPTLRLFASVARHYLIHGLMPVSRAVGLWRMSSYCEPITDSYSMW